MKLIKSSGDLRHFVEKMQKGINKTKLAGIVSFHEEEGGMYVQFEKLGTSKIHYTVTNDSSGFVAKIKKENVAFTHGIFRRDVEKQLVEMMRRFGAEVD
ncbi:MAG TPA: hypothetical protein PK079_22975 [Leptospiraceae bacterium]|nr:hypothetical protein [Leptospiraceae bacterium]HMW05399.1 hypothetical protein [Leptospiraceae bacterium]HMX32843.1 hypothetical protein [Leptospiraceae bacterium]HMY33883.1 hypothetical protein [Leptospiraceae bacterium]HMZ64501.1 hypothetical protein [Leptospiraceae bacterium]